MQFRLIILSFSLLFATIMQAQPANDECQNAINLPISSNWCSNFGEFSNFLGSPSSFAPPGCFGSTGADVWFRFTAVGTDLNLTVNGSQAPSAGGTLLKPQVALYSGNCSGTINQLRCASPFGNNNIVDMYRGALVIGQSYLIRIQGLGGAMGSFQICAQNYNAPALPGSDCVTAAVLCDKSAFAVQSVIGGGLDPDEAFNSCIGGLGGNSESNSTWFKWTCDQSGSFVFTLTPNNASDDLDFVVYELPNGINNCAGKVVRRCMAAGNPVSVFPSICHGPTGLRFTSTDVSESAGCTLGQDNWVAALNLISGRSYAVVVNNFTSTSNGFQIDFGGTATFRGPTADIIVSPSTNGCINDTWTFTDNSSFAFGTITNWNWTFGTDATPATANTKGPHNVSYSSTGQKTISLSIETNEGCIVTHTMVINIDSCCQGANAIQQTNISTDVLCSDDTDGIITITPTTTILTPYSYNWSTGAASNPLTGLSIGNYTVTISNGLCEAIEIIPVEGPPAWQITDNITRPTCGGGTDGAIDILTVSGSNGAPYQFNWNNTGFSSNTSINNLAPGLYSVIIEDVQGCETTVNYTINELQLEIDTLNSFTINPRCFGDSNGSIHVVSQNGLGPYSYIWNTGATGAVINNLSVGTYTLDTIWDANGCRNWSPFSFTLITGDSMSVQLDTFETSCSAGADGQIISTVTGGVHPYQYLWSNTQQDSIATNLAAGMYSLTVTDALNCVIIQTGTITNPFVPTVNPFFNGIPTETTTTIISGTSVNIDGGNAAEAGVSYIWTASPSAGILFEDNSAYATSITATASGIFNLIITASATSGCEDTASIVLTSESLFIGIPNAFSPNNDGVNDVFSLIGLPANEILTFQVFNRWGQLIYDGSNSLTPGWDGRFNNTPQPTEMYLYLIVYQIYGTTEQISLKGEVTLIR
jgi:gliding motility-associated-like protein